MTTTAGRPAAPSRAGRKPSGGFLCAECGMTSIRWVGRCPECQAWGTMVEEGARVVAVPAAVTPARAATPIGEPDALASRVQATGLTEFDRVLGGGLVPGAVMLLAGEPGVGKSTLLLEVAHKFAKSGTKPALIITGEESAAQVRRRAERTNTVHDSVFLAAENDLGAVLSHIDAVDPGLLILDSVQTIATSSAEGSAGGVTQIRAVTAAVSAIAKQRNIATILVGHVTKDGSIAGPRLLEHLVDVVLYFEGDRHTSLRMLRAIKNRHGATDEVGCFEMHEEGIDSLPDPSGLFLTGRDIAVPGTCVTVTVTGRRPLLSEVQALIGPSSNGGSARRSVTDLDTSRVNMLLAVLTRQLGVDLSQREVYAASVGGIKIGEPAVDLAIAMALASGAYEHPVHPKLCAIGEISLSGEIRPVPGLQRRLNEAARLGFTGAIVPRESDVSPIKGLTVHHAGTLLQAWQAVARS